MTAFLDIADDGQRGTAPLRGKSVDITGLSARQIARLLLAHPAARKLVEEGTNKGEPFNLLQLIDMAPAAVASCIAYGTGHDDQPEFGGDKAKFDNAVLRANKLGAGEQYDLLLAIFDLSFGERLNPFVRQLFKGFAARLDGGQPKQDKPPRLNQVSRDSLRQLRNALRSNTTDAEFGITHPGNSPHMPA